jgi:ATP-binding cassette subfamily F protein 3
MYLARFRFFGDDPFRVVRGLSGGERNRMLLAKMMLRPANLLVLDEPTNHLDIPAREVLERTLAEYEGTLLVVSHDRFFLDQVCTRLLVIDPARRAVEPHVGNWSDYRRRAERAERAAAPPAPPPPPPAARAREPEEEPDKDGSRQRFERDRARASARKRKERRLGEVEREVAGLEAELAELRARLAQEHGGDWQRLNALVSDEQRLSERLARLLAEWERLGTELATEV